MAIRKTLTEKVTYYNASDPEDFIEKEQRWDNTYVVVDSIEGSKFGMSMLVVAYRTETKEDVIFRKRFQFTPSVANGSENFLKQAYNHLKTLSEFAGGEDC